MAPFSTGGLIHVSTDKGLTWSKANQSTGALAWASDDGSKVIGAPRISTDGGSFMSTNFGRNFSAMPALQPYPTTGSQRVRALAMSNDAARIFIAHAALNASASKYVNVLSTNGGANFTAVSTQGMLANSYSGWTRGMSATADGMKLAGVYGLQGAVATNERRYSIYLSTDGGATFARPSWTANLTEFSEQSSYPWQVYTCVSPSVSVGLWCVCERHALM